MLDGEERGVRHGSGLLRCSARGKVVRGTMIKVGGPNTESHSVQGLRGQKSITDSLCGCMSTEHDVLIGRYDDVEARHISHCQ